MTTTAAQTPFRVYFSTEACDEKGRQVFGVRYFAGGPARDNGGSHLAKRTGYESWAAW